MGFMQDRASGLKFAFALNHEQLSKVLRDGLASNGLLSQGLASDSRLVYKDLGRDWSDRKSDGKLLVLRLETEKPKVYEIPVEDLTDGDSGAAEAECL